jgi:hypothetical protein
MKDSYLLIDDTYRQHEVHVNDKTCEEIDDELLWEL